MASGEFDPGVHNPEAQTLYRFPLDRVIAASRCHKHGKNHAITRYSYRSSSLLALICVCQAIFPKRSAHGLISRDICLFPHWSHLGWSSQSNLILGGTEAGTRSYEVLVFD